MLISIIIPVYNAEKFISKCLDSVLNQTYQKLEIILVNDGSTDQSGFICEEYAQRDDRVIVIHKENGGVSSARNKGINVAKGKYIGFVDPDDWIDSVMYENLYQLIIDYQADISACGYAMENADGKILNHITKAQIIEYKREDALNTILDTNGFHGFVNNKLFSAELLKKEPPVVFDAEIHFGEDLLFCCENLLKCKKLIYNSYQYYHYFIHENNITQAKFSPQKLTLLKALEKIIGSLKDLEGINTNKFINLYIYSNINLLMNGIKEKKCSSIIRKQLKKNLYKYKLSNLCDVNVKFTYLFARINVYLCYVVWEIYQALL
jgi:glycosyltransferase involved in cell wall biosynthesis